MSKRIVRMILLAVMVLLLCMQVAASDGMFPSTYKAGKKTLTVKTGDMTMTYKLFAEKNNSGYLKRQGCVHTAVSIAASAFGKNYSPAKIFGAKASKVYGEKFAVKQLKAKNKNTYLAGRAAITVTTAAQILADMGIDVDVQYKTPYAKTCNRITAHLRQGLPVIAKCDSTGYRGMNFTTDHHAVVLVGIDAQNQLILVDSWNGKVNCPAMSGGKAKLTVKEFVKNFLYPASAKTEKQPYVGAASAKGGYILVG